MTCLILLGTCSIVATILVVAAAMLPAGLVGRLMSDN